MQDEPKDYSVVRWRNMSAREMWLWAHLRLDKIKARLGMDNRMPNLQEIADKLKEEATKKEYYAYQPPLSVPVQFISNNLIIARKNFCHLINRLTYQKQPASQNKSPNEGQDEACID